MNMTITIKKRSQMGWLIWFLIMMPFLFGILNELLRIPYAVRYSLDIVWCILLLSMIRYRRRINIRPTKKIILWVVVFFVCTLLVYIVQYQSVLYYLWGFRNVFRFYVAFFAFAVFLQPKDIEGFWQLFDKLFWVDVVACVFQFLLMGVQQDRMGGLFSAEGGNSFNNIFMLIVTSKTIVNYLAKTEKLWKCVVKCIAALLVAAISELKFFFVEFLLVVALAVLFTNFTWRKVLVVAGSVSAVVIGAALLTVVFPHWGEWFSLKWFLEAASSDSGYTGSGDLNRLNVIPRVNELWLKNWSQRIFGMGLGNCDTSSFALVNTPFFEKHGDMHYTWISYAMMYLECGWVGLIFYFGFFALVYFAIRKIEKRSDGVAKAYCRVSRIMAVLCMLIAVYNSSLRAESAYMAYFVLAVPFALVNKNNVDANHDYKAERVIESE